MDDETNRLLRELRDIAARTEARDSEWITELRKRYDDSTEKNFKVARWNAWTIWFLLGALIVVTAVFAFIQFRAVGIF